MRFLICLDAFPCVAYVLDVFPYVFKCELCEQKQPSYLLRNFFVLERLCAIVWGHTKVTPILLGLRDSGGGWAFYLAQRFPLCFRDTPGSSGGIRGSNPDQPRADSRNLSKQKLMKP